MRGRKRRFRPCDRCYYQRWNLSPWGDENKYQRASVSKLLPLKFIPVRGRKLPWDQQGIPSHSWNLSPWGDENQSLPPSVPDTSGWNLSPWGDENSLARKRKTFSRVEIYPREGTETFFFFASSRLRLVEIYPREGTETTGYLYRLAHVHGWNLSPWGDGNVHVYAPFISS